MLQGLLGIFSGLITPVQTAVNTRLGRSIGSPLRASLVSFSVGLIAMLTLTLLLGPYPLIPATAANGPWWMWFAGVFGVTFLTGNVLLLPKLGSLKTVIMASHRADRHGPADRRFRLVRALPRSRFPRCASQVRRSRWSASCLPSPDRICD